MENINCKNINTWNFVKTEDIVANFGISSYDNGTLSFVIHLICKLITLTNKFKNTQTFIFDIACNAHTCTSQLNQ